MSEANAERHYRALDAANRRDIEALLALVDPDVEFTPAVLRGLEGGNVYHGHDGFRRWLDDFFSVFPDFRFEIEEMSDRGDLTIARLRNRGHGVGSAAPVEQTTWQVARWRDDRVLWWGTFLSHEEALDAAGLRQ